MKHVDDRSYNAKKMLYTIKIVDMKNLGKEKIPIFVSDVRNFAKTNVPPIMQMYCEHDILILIVNAPFSFRVVWAFASNLISKRQQDRVKTFSDALAAEPQAILKAVARPELLPSAIGGTRSEVPMCFPLAHEDPQRITKWMSRTTNAINRGKVPICPALQKSASRPRTKMKIDADGKATEIKEIVDTTPIASSSIAAQKTSDLLETEQASKANSFACEEADPLIQTMPDHTLPTNNLEEPKAKHAADQIVQNGAVGKLDQPVEPDVIETNTAPATGCFCCASK